MSTITLPAMPPPLPSPMAMPPPLPASVKSTGVPLPPLASFAAIPSGPPSMGATFEEADPESDLKFRPNLITLGCWILGSLFYAWFFIGLKGQRGNVPYMVGGVIGGLLVFGVILLIAGAFTRRIVRQPNSVANVVAPAFMLAWMVLAMIGNQRSARAASPTATRGLPSQAAMPNIAISPTRGGTRTSVATPAKPVVLDLNEQQAVYARRSFLNADGYLMDKSLARKCVALLEERKPWVYIDAMTERGSAEFKKAYGSWKAAEIKAGHDVKVSQTEMEAITRLAAIRQAIGNFRAKNNRPPSLRAIASLPANPFTGQRGLAKSGAATSQHGWSYDEAAGRIRIVLPAGRYAGLAEAEIESF
jgi:hypothetical protein